MTTITKTIQINAPKQKVWQILSNLETVQNYSPAVANSFYTSDNREGVGASRQCDWEGGYIKEQITAWQLGEGYSFIVSEDGEPGSPMETQVGHFALAENGPGTLVTMTFEYSLKAGAPVDPQEIEQMWAEELLPGILAGLKHYLETGEPMPKVEAVNSSA